MLNTNPALGDSVLWANKDAVTGLGAESSKSIGMNELPVPMISRHTLTVAQLNFQSSIII